MKKVLGLVGASLLFAGSALAADLGKPVYKAPPSPVPVPSWAGLYIGIHGGYGWGHESAQDIFPFSNPSPKGGVFGGQIGYNWQFNTYVAGLEVDSSWADLKDSQSVTVTGTINGVPASLTETLSSKVDYLGSARVRAGFLLMPDWLIYGTGGVGWAHDKLTVVDTATVGGVSATASESASKTHVGWAAGGGVEYKLLPNVLLRAEYLHYGFGSETYNFSLGDTLNSKLSVDVVRGGLSYKF